MLYKELNMKNINLSPEQSIAEHQRLKDERIQMKNELKKFIQDKTVELGVRFVYYGDYEKSKGCGKIVVAYTDKHIGFSFCSPKDVYSKIFGKVTALVRLINFPIEITNANFETDPFHIAIDYAKLCAECPAWAKKQSYKTKYVYPSA